MYMEYFKWGVAAGLSLTALISIPIYTQSDKHITPEEFSFYDESCLKDASTTKSLSIDIDDAVLKCHNGATFEFDRRNYEKESKE